MACQVSECDNILCDTYVYDVGYICNHCQARFKDSYTGLPDEESILQDLKEFVDQPVVIATEDSKQAVVAFFRQHTRE